MEFFQQPFQPALDDYIAGKIDEKEFLKKSEYYLRWRIETYWGLHAEKLTGAETRRFMWEHRAELIRFLRWAERMHANA